LTSRVHFVVFLVGIDEGFEFHRREGHAVADRGLHLHHVVERGDAILDGLGDQPLEILGIRARIEGRDGEPRYLEIGILLARHLVEGEPAERHQAQERHQRELIPPDREFQDRHGGLPGAPSNFPPWARTD
jgi:hypothetical protein